MIEGPAIASHRIFWLAVSPLALGAAPAQDMPGAIARTRYTVSNERTSEGGTLYFTITRTGDLSQDVIIYIQTMPGSAKEGVDYKLPGAGGKFRKGKSKLEIQVQTIRGDAVRLERTFTIRVTEAFPGGKVDGAVGTGTILADPPPPPPPPPPPSPQPPPPQQPQPSVAPPSLSSPTAPSSPPSPPAPAASTVPAPVRTGIVPETTASPTGVSSPTPVPSLPPPAPVAAPEPSLTTDAHSYPQPSLSSRLYDGGWGIAALVVALVALAAAARAWLFPRPRIDCAIDPGTATVNGGVCVGVPDLTVTATVTVDEPHASAIDVEDIGDE